MGNESVGAILKAQREQNQMDLDAVCRKTYIRQSYLDAIERGEYKVIGDPVYVKGFIRNYAQAVGLDGDAMVRQFNAEIHAAYGISIAEKKRWEKTETAAPVRRGHVGRRTDRKHFTRLEWMILLTGFVLFILFWIWLFYF